MTNSDNPHLDIDDLASLFGGTTPEPPRKQHKTKATFQSEKLEDRVLFSATWMDMDAEAIDGPSGEDDMFSGSEGNDRANGRGGDDLLSGLAGNDVLSGGDGNDTIDGGEGNDRLSGGAGNDIIEGGTGNDRLSGGSGDDTFVYSEGDGVDRFSGGKGTDTIDVSDADTLELNKLTQRSSIEAIDGAEEGTKIEGTSNRDALDFSKTELNNISEIDTGAGNDTVRGSQGDDVIDGGSGRDSIGGGAGDDTITGGTGNDNLRGGAGDDTFVYNEGDGVDRFSGGKGTDTIDATNAESIELNNLTQKSSIESIEGAEDGTKIEGTAKRDVLDFSKTELNNISELNTGAGNDTVRGSQGNDVIDGGSGRDSIRGGAGDDTIIGGKGNDNLRGDAGSDTFIYNEGDGVDRFRGGQGDDTVDATNAETLNMRHMTARDSIESIDGAEDGTRIEGTSGRNVMDFSKTELNNITEIDAGAGNDTVRGSQADDVIIGGKGNDNLRGEAGDDTFIYNEGDGADRFNGGSGNDTVDATNAETLSMRHMTAKDSIETIDGAEEGTRIEGTERRNRLDFSQTELNNITEIDAGAGNDTVVGSQADDVIIGGEGNDNLRGGAGDDTFIYNEGDGVDRFNGGSGNDTVDATNAETLSMRHMTAKDSIETIDGAEEGTRIEGTSSRNVMDFSKTELNNITEIDAGAGDDVIRGSQGDDVIIAGAGDDRIDGNGGDDVLKFDGNRSDYEITKLSNGSFSVEDLRDGSPDGTDIVREIETFQFADGQAAVGESVEFTPDSLQVSECAIAENAEAGTVVGSLGADDTFGESHTYQIVDEAGNVVENDHFEMNGNEIVVKAGADIDFEESASHELRIEATDAEGNSHTTNVTIDVTDVNEGPTATDHSFKVAEDGSAKGNLLEGASDADGDKLTVEKVSQPENGSVKVDADGNFEYQPDANFSGTDSFTFEVSDGNGGVVTQEVTIEVAAEADGVELDVEDAKGQVNTAIPLNISADLLDADGSESIKQISISGMPEGAELSAGEQQEDGSWEVSPEDLSGLEIKLEGGTDDFKLNVEVTTQDGDQQIVQFETLVVDVQNTGPTATDHSFKVAEDGSAKGNLLEGASDADGDKLTVEKISQPENGSVKVDADGNFEYRPDANFSGTDSFKFTVSDGNGGFVTQEVNIEVAAEADGVDLQVESAAGQVLTSIPLDISADLIDADGSESIKQISISGVPEGAELSAGERHEDGSWEVSQNDLSGLEIKLAGGTDDFKLNVEVTTQDGDQKIVQSEVLVVDVQNSGPTAADQSFKISEDGSASGNLLKGAGDVDGDDLTVEKVTQPEHGTVKFDSNGEFIYQPDANFSGTDSFTFEVSDGNGGVVTQEVNIEVDAVVDGVDLQVESAAGQETDAIPLDIGVDLLDSDGSESIKRIVISGMPEGATLSNGVVQPDGSWEISPADLPGLEIQLDGVGNDDFELTVEVTTEDFEQQIVQSKNLRVEVGNDALAAFATQHLQGGEIGETVPNAEPISISNEATEDMLLENSNVEANFSQPFDSIAPGANETDVWNDPQWDQLSNDFEQNSFEAPEESSDNPMDVVSSAVGPITNLLDFEDPSQLLTDDPIAYENESLESQPIDVVGWQPVANEDDLFDSENLTTASLLALFTKREDNRRKLKTREDAMSTK